MKIDSKIKYIFVDYFDTTCFRHIHSSQIYLQWAKVMKAKFPELGIISNDELVALRHMAHHKNNKLILTDIKWLKSVAFHLKNLIIRVIGNIVNHNIRLL